MRFILVLSSAFELLQEPMRFILVLRSMFELLQETMRFILVLRSTFELPQEPIRFLHKAKKHIAYSKIRHEAFFIVTFSLFSSAILD